MTPREIGTLSTRHAVLQAAYSRLRQENDEEGAKEVAAWLDRIQQELQKAR